MELGKAQTFASPGEALEHFGIKGMRWGIRKEKDTAPGFPGFGEPYDISRGLGNGIKGITVKKSDQVRVDHSQGFADVIARTGFASPTALRVHDELAEGIKQMRDQYPSVASAKIEMVPMSQIPIAKSLLRAQAPAAVMSVKPGEIRIVYNDRLNDFSPKQKEAWAKWVPGMAHDGYVGSHEMGHVLAAAHGTIRPAFTVLNQKTSYKQLAELMDHSAKEKQAHLDLFSKHGLDFTKLAKISQYAATSPQEALAEAVGNYNTPALRKNMDADTQRRVKSMLDDMGGKK